MQIRLVKIDTDIREVCRQGSMMPEAREVQEEVKRLSAVSNEPINDAL